MGLGLGNEISVTSRTMHFHGLSTQPRSVLLEPLRDLDDPHTAGPGGAARQDAVFDNTGLG